MVAEAPPHLYRIIAAAVAVEEDFLSNAVKHVRDLREGRRPRRIPDSGGGLYLWSGVSVYNSAGAAREVARAYSLGQYLALLTVEGADPQAIHIEKTGRSEAHYTLWASPAALLARIQSVQPVCGVRAEP